MALLPCETVALAIVMLLTCASAKESRRQRGRTDLRAAEVAQTITA